MIKRIFKSVFVDAIALANIAAIIPLFGDLVWLHHDWSSNGFAYAFVFILVAFTTTTIASIYAAIWYHKQAKEHITTMNDVYIRILLLELQVKELQKKNNVL